MQTPPKPKPLSDEDLFSNCLDLAYYQYNLESVEDENDGYDEFVQSFEELYGAARQRYQGKTNNESFYKRKNDSVTIFGKLYDACLNSFNTDDILEFMGSRYEAMEKMKVGVNKFLEGYPNISSVELTNMIVTDLIEHRVRPIDKNIMKSLKNELGDPFYFISDALRFALVPFLDAAKGIETKYGKKYPEAMMNLFEDTVVKTVDSARLLFKNDLKGVEQFIKTFMKGHQKMSGKNAQFNDMMGVFGAQLILEKYCKARNLTYIPDDGNFEDLLVSMQPMMSAMGTMQEIVREFPRNEEESKGDENKEDDLLFEECLNECKTKDFCYNFNMNGKNVTVWEGMSVNELMMEFNIKEEKEENSQNNITNQPTTTIQIENEIKDEPEYI
ncbi:hypothetical protein EHI8A_034040 [Entamoeba histolytica HM-1:IMSS-B]|uniref:Uncharacterized protein n=4 Tax=Entamoeba histolytica TaxID=5759 RepID=C4M0L3_ENTH1|nr:hypothetical protein EHI_008370 [Entamoeba histolytica HM-1:IMSS]EAL47171.1 hypothetical protein EHI_008370 [Entamoeba histolytica HM-1:IMSS]EMH72207.1 hypothetical protein EHI8A_034040 [Entamoeba histolytica HM-1:IMSS-B]ENY63703.1 hypothetical protein EHI7A_035610 [Entamoeba histolytica HM-1:IMSS-A]GAT94707.1 hypothetical protein CL6EHI_008370 [Entamoeba histolytica]|eukprot:XP_652557.1 hypothetical protein EHI_008370 [Entamoeba histolytica HM-1:IMSS]